MKTLTIILLFIASVSFGQLILNGNTAAGKVTIEPDGTINCANIIQTNIYGVNESFQTSYTIPLTEDNYAQITNASKTLWTFNCGNGFTSSGDTLICQQGGNWGGMLTFRGTGGNGDDYEVRLYDVTAGAAISGIWLPFSTTGASNYAGGVTGICFCSVEGHRYVWQIQNTSDNDDFTTIFATCWFILMKTGSCP